MNKLVSIQDIQFSYGKTQVLNNINLEIYENEFIAIIGPNGCGKSTLLKLILQQLTPQEGIISWKKPLMNYNVQYIAQQKKLNFGRLPASVFEVVGISIYKDKDKKKKVAAILEKLGLKGFEKKLMNTLSGGELQRVMLAKALISNPKVVIVDEPTSAIDKEGVQQLYQQLALLKEKMTIVMVTHDIYSALDYVDRIFCIEKGSGMLIEKEELIKESMYRHRHV